MAAEKQLLWWQTKAFVLLMIVLAVIPLLAPPIPPLTDVPGHMGSYRVMIGTDAATLNAYFRFHWKLVGYLGGEAVISVLGPILGLELAMKVMIVAIPALATAGILGISREVHGRIQPHALFALPFVYNIAFQYGFVNYTLAMALMLNAFALWLRLGRKQQMALRAILFVPISCAIWAAHLFGWLVLGVLALSAEVARRRSCGDDWLNAFLRGGVQCLPLALPFAMFFLWHPGDGHAGEDYWATLRYKPGWLAMALVDRWRAFDVASVALAICVLYYGLRSATFRRSPALAAGALGLFVVFLAMPFGTAYADARLLPYVIIIALVAIGAGERTPLRAERILAAAGAGFFAIRIAAATLSMNIESADWQQRLAIVDHIPHGARVAAFVTNHCRQAWRVQRLNHLPSMAIVRKSAFTNDQYDLGTAATLTVVAPGLDGFALDPSEMVTTTPCPNAGGRTLAQAISQFPRNRFDFAWLIAPEALDPRLLHGMTLMYRTGGDFLFRIDRPDGVSSSVRHL